MRRLRHIWVVFGLCLAVVLAGMGWISLTALRLERVEAQADRRAAVEERIRLALWRMDSALTPLIARESARPYFAYTAFHPVDRAYTRMFAEIRPREILVPSPLLTYRSPDVLMHFQIDPSGVVSSPQVPVGNQRDLAETGYVAHDLIESAAGRLERLKAAVVEGDLLAALGQADAAFPATVPSGGVPPQRQGLRRFLSQRVLNTNEWRMRNLSARNATVSRSLKDQLAWAPARVREGPIRTVWIGRTQPMLVFARRVTIAEKPYVQGCWLNWAYIHDWLLASIEDLLPEAELAARRPGHPDLLAASGSVSSPAGRQAGEDRPSEDSAGGDGRTCQLAALPVSLVPGAVDDDVPAYSWPLRLSLWIAWGCVLSGALAVALLLGGAVTLSERRGAFVSAVTHELRTPLTTFRLYAEMLDEGMVSDPNKRADYVRCLREEAERLSHLVENVLAYARLSRRRGRRLGGILRLGASPAAGRLETVSLAKLIERTRQRLARRAEQAQMQLLLEATDDAEGTPVRADAAAVEQILLNLVDNACKYAARSADHTIHVQLDRQGKLGLIRVRDHGPGVTPAEARRLFRPFRKSAKDAARSAPGVGLGLAISRRLAREMHGRLHLDQHVKDGACFVLSLPAEGD